MNWTRDYGESSRLGVVGSAGRVVGGWSWWDANCKIEVDGGKLGFQVLLACQLQGQRSGWLERDRQGCRARVTAMRLTGVSSVLR